MQALQQLEANLFTRLKQLTSCIEHTAKQSVRPIPATIVRADDKSSPSSFSTAGGSLIEHVSQPITMKVSLPVDKLPSFIQTSTNIGDVSFVWMPKVTIQTIALYPRMIKESILDNNIKRLIDNIPSPWKKVRLMKCAYLESVG